MAELPDGNIVQLGAPGSRRPVSTIDTSAVSRAGAALASGTETLGKGITSAAHDVAAALKPAKPVDDSKLKTARAKASLAASLVNHRNAVEKATDPNNLVEGTKTKIDADIRAAATVFDDPRERETFDFSARENEAYLLSAAETRASDLTRDAVQAADEKLLKQLGEGAAASNDPHALNLAVHSVRDIVDGWVSAGWTDPAKAAERQTSWARDLAKDKLNALPLGERLEALNGSAASRFGALASMLARDDLEQMRIDAQREQGQATIKVSHDAFNAIRQTLTDATHRRVPLPVRETIENNPNLLPPEKSRALALHDSAAVEAAGLGRFMTRLWDDSAGPFNPADPDERKYADRAFVLLGGETLALQTVVGRTRILPNSAAVQLRGAMISGDPTRVADALTISSNLYTANPNIFIGVGDQAEFENDAVAFRHYVDTRGMSADEAAKRIIRDRSPEHQAHVQARLKAEDVDRKLGRALNAGDLAGEFAEVSWADPFDPFDPKVGFDPATRKELFDHYADEVKARYLETGDIALAKVQAADQLKRVWGVTRVNGSQTVMPYPPDRAPAYAGIDNAADHIAAHAVEMIKAGTGEEVDRSRIVLWPIPGVTATQYKSGRPPQYLLMWFDKKGDQQMLARGKAFEAPPDMLFKAQTDRRAAALARKVAIAGAIDDTARDPRAPFGVDFPAIRLERRR
jgi:hypothetical protein